MFSIRDFIVYFALPILNFVIWFKMGQQSIIQEVGNHCPSPEAAAALVPAAPPPPRTAPKRNNKKYLKFEPPQILDVDSKEFSSYSEEALVELFFPGKSRTLLVNHHSEECTSYINPSTSQKQECLAVAVTDSESSSLDLRFNGAAKKPPLVLDGEH